MEKKYTALVLEDEKPLQLAIKLKLESENFEVVTARSVEEALSYLKQIPNIAIIWLDHYLLGRENGLDFVANIKNTDVWNKIPIFVVSNTASPDKVTSYISLGVDKFYTKAEYRLDQIIGDIKKKLV